MACNSQIDSSLALAPGCNAQQLVEMFTLSMQMRMPWQRLVSCQPACVPMSPAVVMHHEKQIPLVLVLRKSIQSLAVV